MIGPLVVAAIVAAAGEDQRRGRVWELHRRVGLPDPGTDPRGSLGRLWRALSAHPELTRRPGGAVALHRDLRAAGVEVDDQPRLTDPLVDWYVREAALCLRQGPAVHLVGGRLWSPDPVGGAIDLLIDNLRLIRDWYAGARPRPDIGRLSFGQAYAEANRWHDDLAAGHAPRGGRAVPPGQVMHAWPDGWTVQRPDLLDVRAEGQSMQNCLAEGAYDEAMRDGEAEIYSLRKPPDAAGWSVPVVTMAWATGRIYTPYQAPAELLARFLAQTDVRGDSRLDRARGNLATLWIDLDGVSVPAAKIATGQLPRLQLDGLIRIVEVGWLRSEFQAFVGDAVNPDLQGWEEIRGRQNQVPAPEYRERLLEFMLLPRSSLAPGIGSEELSSAALADLLRDLPAEHPAARLALSSPQVTDWVPLQVLRQRAERGRRR